MATQGIIASTLHTPKVSADILCEFLDVAFHSILYVRELYPTSIFKRKRKYDVPIQICSHPGVAQYIVQLMKSIRSQIEQDKVERIAFVVMNEQLQPLEKFVFELEISSGVPISEKNDYLLKFEQTLRAFLLKLYTSHASLHTLPKGCTWTVQIHTVDSTIIDLQRGELIEDFKWIEADESQIKIHEPNMVPLKSMSTPAMKMQLYVEESPSKHKDTS